MSIASSRSRRDIEAKNYAEMEGEDEGTLISIGT